jgi:nucleotide-binding universal stress UspA family protein
MDLTKLKKRPSFPFETIAVAIGFTPRLEGILTQAKKLSEMLNAQLIIIHIGNKDKRKEKMLDEMISRLKMDNHSTRLIWMEGEPVETILRLCKLYIVDLLIIGALEKENMIKYYLGSVARTISRKAKCSVLLLTHPENGPEKIKKVIVTGVANPKTIHTVNTALYLAENFKIKEITVVQEMDTPGLAMTMAESSSAPETSRIKKEFIEEETNKLHSIIDRCRPSVVKINEKTVKGKPGFAVRNYAEAKKADLLVINSPDTNLNILDRIFTHDIEFILEDLPCNLLIVHSRV